MKNFLALLPCAALTSAAVVSAPAWAQVSIQNPWVRATVPQQQGTGAFFTIRSAHAARLVQVQSPLSDAVEIHEMQMQGDVMKMRAISGVDLPAGQAVELKPGGYHIMLLNLKQQVKEGSTVPLTLVIERADKNGTPQRETVQVQAPVRALNSVNPAAAPKHSSQH